MKPSQLLVEAKRLLEHGDRPHAALRLRAATLLARQALEGRADELLRRRVSQLEEARFDARLLLLEEVIRERALARHMRFVWAALSSACHLHAYELPPALADVEGWIGAVQRFLDGSDLDEG